MRTHQDEVHLAKLYAATLPSSYLSSEQTRLVIAEGQSLYRWFRNNLSIHYAISAAVFVFLVTVELYCLFAAPRHILGFAHGYPILGVIVAGILAGLVHGWVGYSFTAFTMHEGAAHNLIFPARGPVTSWLNNAANQLCRLGGADPDYYAFIHRKHHEKFGTDEDAEFLNFVRPERFYQSLIPYSSVIGLSDFTSHHPVKMTRGYLISVVVALAFSATLFIVAAKLYGYLFALPAIVIIGPNFGFILDRMRQFSEHNLMQLNRSGARSFGIGPWGLLVGGGPWGSPCHLMHHLMWTLPWYQQIRLHYFTRRLLTPEQREILTADQRVFQYPRILRRVLRDSTKFAADNA